MTLSQHDLRTVNRVKACRHTLPNFKAASESQVVETIDCSLLDVVGSEDFFGVKLFKQYRIRRGRQVRSVDAGGNGKQSEETITHGRKT